MTHEEMAETLEGIVREEKGYPRAGSRQSGRSTSYSEGGSRRTPSPTPRCSSGSSAPEELSRERLGCPLA
jgi:hypothetical protein